MEWSYSFLLIPTKTLYSNVGANKVSSPNSNKRKRYHFYLNTFFTHLFSQFIREPRNSSKVDEVLKVFQKHIDNNYSDPVFPSKPKGAMLSCVVGGKLSEGINFSDGYGRCVIMIGLPFPNPNDPVLQEKVKFVESQSKDSTNIKQEYLENLCMKAVNQSIGRAIRHKDDYASIVLLDQRFSQGRISSKLPKWIGSSLVHSPNFGTAFSNIVKFFQSKKENQNKLEKERSEKHKI
jgi:chromosome transmission fidelity protein 1